MYYNNTKVDITGLKEFVDSSTKKAKETKPPEKDTRTYLPYGVYSKESTHQYSMVDSRMSYVDVSDFINNRPFHAYFPQSFTPLPAMFERNKTMPLFSVKEDEDVARGVCTIATMIELIHNDQPLTIRYDTDILLIKEVVDTYTNILSKFQLDTRTKAFLKKVKKFSVRVDHQAKIVNKKMGRIPKEDPRDARNILQKLLNLKV